MKMASSSTLRNVFLGKPLHVCYLGYLLSENGVSPLPDKIKAVEDFPLSATFRKLSSYLGLINYCRTHVLKLDEAATPMT